MKTPKLKFKNGPKLEPYIEGDFNFKLDGDVIYSPEDYSPIIKIYFEWCPEVYQDESFELDTDEVFELIAEKLKQDFIKFSKDVTANT